MAQKKTNRPVQILGRDKRLVMPLPNDALDLNAEQSRTEFGSCAGVVDVRQ